MKKQYFSNVSKEDKVWHYKYNEGKVIKITLKEKNSNIEKSYFRVKFKYCEKDFDLNGWESSYALDSPKQNQSLFYLNDKPKIDIPDLPVKNKKIKLWECQDCGKLTVVVRDKEKPSCWCCVDQNGVYSGDSKSKKNIQKKVVARYVSHRKGLYFEKIKNGDKVWDYALGEGSVVFLNKEKDSKKSYFQVKFDYFIPEYDLSGRQWDSLEDWSNPKTNQTLFYLKYKPKIKKGEK